MLNKKAQLHEHWPETLGFFFLVLGLAIAIAAPSTPVSYAIIFLAGMMAGRLWYRQKHNFKVSWFIILLGFVIGYLIGGYYTNKNLIIVFFLIGALLAYWLHDKGIISSTEW